MDIEPNPETILILKPEDDFTRDWINKVVKEFPLLNMQTKSMLEIYCLHGSNFIGVEIRQYGSPGERFNPVPENEKNTAKDIFIEKNPEAKIWGWKKEEKTKINT